MMQNRLTPPIHGLMAEFESAEQLVEAARQAHEAGYRRMDAYTPFPVHGLREAMGVRKTRLPWLVLAGGAVGFIAGYGMQYFAQVIHWPINIGGRPLHSWPNYIPIVFEMTVLVASLTAFLSVVIINGLPRPHHPVFNVDKFDRASTDRFFLCIEADDPKFDTESTRLFLQELKPASVSVVEE